MGALPKHRAAIVEAAARLFRRQGYAATGVHDIATLAQAPKGSLYHYFPGGKDEIAEAAVRFAGARVATTLQQLADETASAADLVRRYGTMLQGWMAQSGFRDGCPITTTLLETAPQLDGPTAAGRESFADWCEIIAAALVRDGVGKAEAKRLSTLVISALEGSMILTRVQGDGQAIRDVTETLAKMLRDRVKS
jgi:TetR/AcrR family transcriptional regulator, lmrAB and yxaGH operons repressor